MGILRIPGFADLRTSKITEIAIFIIFTKTQSTVNPVSCKRTENDYDVKNLENSAPFGLFGDNLRTSEMTEIGIFANLV